MLFPNNEAAKTHALEVIHELKEDGGYEDPDLFITVEEWDGRVIFSRRFS